MAVAGGGSMIPLLAMIIVQLGYAGMNIISKLAMQSGMNPLVLVAYRQILATAAIAPVAYWFERKTVPRMTKPIMIQILLSSITGITGNQVFYFVGLKYSTATIACALTNLLPAFTFFLAVLFRQEIVRFKARTSQAKVFGTVLSVGGALLLSFYHGKMVGLGQSGIHWSYAERMGETDSSNKPNLILGPFMIILSAVVWAVWFVVQADMSKKFPAPYTSSTYMCLLGSIQCVVLALCFEHTASAWSLRNSMRLVSALYAGIICTGLAYCLMAWTIQRKGPLYVSVFGPLQLVLVAILSWALIQEKLYVGTVVGSVLIVIGLYAVLWGKKEEDEVNEVILETKAVKESPENVKNDVVDLELQPNKPSNGKHHVEA